MIVDTLKNELNLKNWQVKKVIELIDEGNTIPKNWQVKKVIELIDEGNTIPFIARYRKDVTGSLNDETLRKFDERLRYLRNLEEKKIKVIKRIEELGKLDDDLKSKILAVETLVELEDFYRPYKSKKQTRAEKARQKGLDPLAQIILKQEV
ncbi:Tex-like N-terminal domain-containing protein, partial [uncultured Methanobrevibacter sp.]|uniref:Tex-like N-terminal domain-containing protein n=1 Tax=uncultured Methanobrevibacter sp. TaxID=253161 RepID=UPI00260159F6